jgi:bacterioferritin
MLEEEEGHVDWLEAQLDQIKRTGMQMYPAEQIY